MIIDVGQNIRRYGKDFFYNRKTRKIFEKGIYIFFCKGEEKWRQIKSILRWRRKDAEGKGGKYLEKENTFMQRRRGKEEEIYWKRKDCCGQDGTNIKGSIRGSRGPKKRRKNEKAVR